MQRGDVYRWRAKEMLFVASQSRRFREEFLNLAAAFVRLAEQADRNEQIRMHLDDAAAHKMPQPQQRDQQQRQGWNWN